MKPPYIKKICKINRLSFFYVNGAYIRKHLEKDFVTNADYKKYKFIPKKEIWIEQEFSKKEYEYYIKFFLAKAKYLSQGKPYKKAVRLGNIIEQKQRNKSKIVQKLRKLSKKQQIIKIHKKFLKNYSNKKIKTWIVKGFLVRSLYYLDFTAGGHDKVYKFIPEKEIWIDDATNPKETFLTLLHELYERKLMSKDKTSKTIKKSYEKAHEKALKIESYYRNNPKALKQRIRQELINQP